MREATVFGAGSWGTAIAYLLSQKGCSITLWGRNPRLLERVALKRQNEAYLPNVMLPRSLQTEPDLQHAANAAQLWIMAVPSYAMRDVAKKISPQATEATTIVNLAKGLEANTAKTMSQVLQEEAPRAAVFTLSGPSHAEEVGQDFPTSVVIAGTDQAQSAPGQQGLILRFRKGEAIEIELRFVRWI